MSNRPGAIRSFVGRLMACPPVFLAALREIFDESAYSRFLHRQQMVSSREAYAAFCREGEAAKARRPRCC